MKKRTTQEVIDYIEEKIDDDCSEVKYNQDYYTEQDEKKIRYSVMKKKKWIEVDDLEEFIEQYETTLGDLPKELSELKKALSETTDSKKES